MTQQNCTHKARRCGTETDPRSGLPRLGWVQGGWAEGQAGTRGVGARKKEGWQGHLPGGWSVWWGCVNKKQPLRESQTRKSGHCDTIVSTSHNLHCHAQKKKKKEAPAFSSVVISSGET